MICPEDFDSQGRRNSLVVYRLENQSPLKSITVRPISASAGRVAKPNKTVESHECLVITQPYIYTYRKPQIT
ncbi:hypothetical protein HMPREF3156_00263 [Neisseria sp. HMSC06F02]|nr:hypothetical protein HMPREF3156_00263 [Neisseria sp. HMSC06F02]